MFCDWYSGKNNPKGYSIAPRNRRDAVSMGHDINYDAFDAHGPYDVVFNGKVIFADMLFVKQQYSLTKKYLSNALSLPLPTAAATSRIYVREACRSFVVGTGIAVHLAFKNALNNPYLPKTLTSRGGFK